MLSKRVIVIAADKPFQKRLIAGAMAAGGAVQGFAAAEELPGRIEADLVLYALGWQLQDGGLQSLLARLPEGARLVPILPAPQLEGMVSLLTDPRISTVLVAEEMSAVTVSSTVSKLLYGDLFGLDKVMPWGVRIYSMLVSDYHEKSLAIGTIGDFASALGVRRKYREQIDQCIDEMLMNALYDAPVDEAGKPLFADVPVKERVGIKVAEKAVLQYSCDGERFAVSVRDGFGSLRKNTVLSYLDKCLHAAGPEQIDRKAGGAGLGLYLIANSATEVYFHIFGGQATEVVCCFNLSATRSQLRSFGIFEESLDTRQRAPVGPARPTTTLRGRRREDLAAPPPQRSALLPAMMTLAVMLLLASVTLVALPYLKKPVVAALRIESEPPGATIYIDGRKRGSSPLTASGLEAGRSYSLRASLTGHRDDDQLVTTSEGDSTVRLRLGALAGTVVVESEPSGAIVMLDGQDTGKRTPATLELPSGKHAELSLRKEGFRGEKVHVTGPGPGERAIYRAVLPLSRDVAGLAISVQPSNATVTVDGMALMPPASSYDTFVKPGVVHKIKITAPGYIDYRKELSLAGGEHQSVSAHLQEGGVLMVKTNISARVFIDDKPVGTAPLSPLALPEGVHTVALRGLKPYLSYSVQVTVERGKTVEARVDFGTVEVKAPGVVAQPSGSDAPVTLLQLPVGPQKLALANTETGEKREREVVISPGGKVVIDSW